MTEVKGTPAACLVTGASGFIGSRLLRALAKSSIQCRALSRRPLADRNALVGDILDAPSMVEACNGVETVFHCAGYAHAFKSLSGADADMHWTVNFEGARNLVNAAGRAGVKRFVFLSSVKAMAEPGASCVDESFSGEPDSDYGRSKLAAEGVVAAAGKEYGMHVVNLRLAMVYGRGGKGNLERMGRMVARGWFPPLPETHNHRSLVHVDDVVSAMQHVALDPRANGHNYIVASRDAPSGRELYDALRAAQHMKACTWAIPEWGLRMAAQLGDGLGRLSGRRMPFDSEVLDRLLESAWYSPARIEQELGWEAQVPLKDGLCEMLGQ